jgi:hypothetical protein
MPDVTAIMKQAAPVRAQIPPVVPHISAKLMDFPVVSPLHSLVQLPLVPANITPVCANVIPVLTPVNSVPSKVSPVAAQAASFAQREPGSQDCKHHQTYELSSHIASLVSGPYGL